MNRLPIKLAIAFCIMSIIIFGGCILYAMNLYTEANLNLAQVNAQYANEEVIQTSSSWINRTPLTYTDGISVNDYAGYNAIYKFNSTYFISYSEQWDEGKLHDLAVELYNNAHGEEINYVARVEVVDGETDTYAGYHTSEYENFALPIAMYGALPISMTMEVTSRFSVIRLTGADTNNTVELMAKTMSHEYGHHYTQFYFGFTGTDYDLTTKYYDIRKEDGYNIYSESPSWEYYLANHMWNVQELAAEDYVYFMGSDLARRSVDYKDAKELVEVYAKNTSEYEEIAEMMTKPAYNSSPHENSVLRSPNQVAGLSEYYYSFISESAREFTEIVTTDLNINIESDGAYGYVVHWSQYYTDPSVTYTLLVFDLNDNLVKIVKTTSGNEPGTANIGTYITNSNMMEYTVSDEIPTMGQARFKVVTVLSDGTAFYSEPFDVQFT